MTEFDDQEQPESEPDENAYALNPQSIARIMYAVDIQDREQLWAEMEPLHAADIADLLEQLNAFDRRRLIDLYGTEFDGDVLTELDESIREEVLNILNPEVLAEAVRDLDSDDVVDLVEDLETARQEAILGVLEDSDRVAVKQSLTYPDYSAGRLMQREVVMAPEHWNVGEAIDYLRNQEDLPDQFYHIVMVDPKLRPVGNVTLGKLMASRREVLLSTLAEETFHTIPVTQDEGDVAYAFNQYHLISAPVVDENDRLVGVITKQRFPWLAVNLVTAILASLVISMFEATIAQFVALAVLMPIVASMGGNAGTQSLTVAVRAIATKDLTGRNVWRVIRREVLVGLVNGVAFAVVMGAIGVAWFGGPQLGYVIGVAMVVNLVVAGFAGTVIPVLLQRMGVDPALASGAFVTTVTDVVGFFVFLGLAAIWLL